MFATVHNAMSSLRDGFLGYNNLLPLEDALKAGFRGLLLDSCDCNDGDVDFCHAVCVVGRRDAGTVFNSIVTFLTANPTDVIIIELEINDNSLDRLWASTSSAFRALLYTHPGVNTAWPTLNDLISKGKRIIVFQHNGPNCGQSGSCPAGVHDAWTYAFQTTWELNGVNDLADYSKSCVVKSGSKTNAFMLSNHFASGNLGLPSLDVAKQVNKASVLQARLDACKTRLGKQTNLLAVDFWSVGDVIQVVNNNNANLGGGTAPTKAPTTGGGIGCFSGDTTVVVENRGTAKMRDLNLGDKVLVSWDNGGMYEPIYSFGHIDQTTSMKYLQFQPSNLEMTWNHMVLVEGKGAIPASLVRIGDILAGAGQVTAIRNVDRRGMYAPFTPCGKIVVNGVIASTYVSFEESSVLTFGTFETPLSYQWLAHSFLLPHRIWCYHLGTCTRAQYDDDGFWTWIEKSFQVARWFKEQSTFLAMLLFLPFVLYLAVLNLIEIVVLQPTMAMALLCLTLPGATLLVVNQNATMVVKGQRKKMT